MKKTVTEVILIVVGFLICVGVVFAAVDPDTPAEPNELETVRKELALAKAEIQKLKFANLPPIEDQVAKADATWIQAYGDTEKTQVYYNIRLLTWALSQHTQAMKALNDPNDPNSLISRVTVIEERIEAIAKLTNITHYDENGKMIGGFDPNDAPVFSADAITKETRKNEVDKTIFNAGEVSAPTDPRHAHEVDK